MEKRDTDRAKKRLMVRYGPDAPTKMAFTKNLSVTGLHIQTNSVLKPGTRIQIELKFPSRTFSLWGQVMWAKKVPPQLAYTIPCGMGVKFVEPPEEWKAFFSEWKSGGS